MSELPFGPTRKGSSATTETDRILSELESLLSEQISLVHEDRLAELDTRSARIEELLALAPGGGGAVPDGPRLKRIALLYNELCLILAAGKKDVSDRLSRLATGRTSLRAYRGSGS